MCSLKRGSQKGNREMLRDINGTQLISNNIIDIKQTVNGCNEFLILLHKNKVTNAYYYRDGDILREYEYDLDELIEDFNGEPDYEIVGYMTDKEFKDSIIKLNTKLSEKANSNLDIEKAKDNKLTVEEMIMIATLREWATRIENREIYIENNYHISVEANKLLHINFTLRI